MRLTPWKLVPLLFGSGFCALAYQVAWFRELRLVFGASTLATSAVLAIFIGGLGLGGLYWGPRADRSPRPLWLYASLEIGVALGAALTPALLWLVRGAYLGLGGQTTLGLVLGTALRLVLAALVLAPPTLLMGGTLPAAVRAVASDEDAQRRGLGLLYGANTLGAVAGAFSSSFVLLEVLGTRQTLWAACLLNLLVAMVARALSRGAEPGPPAPAAPPASPVEPAGQAGAPARLVLAAAAVVGFAFFLLEVIWYRMLGPLLGGTVFTFGLILSFALLGIGAGGALYGRSTHRPPAPSTFATTCLLEALAVAAPFALGDRLAVAALFLRQLAGFGFAGMVLGWSAIAAVVVLPAALVAGYQFPLLIALLGRGRSEVGRQVGLAYAWNTGGSMAGALAGGFALLPLLGATALWRLTAALLLALGLGAAALAASTARRWRSLALPLALLVPAAALLSARGPTAAWRHSGIGAGRVHPAAAASPVDIEEFLRKQRRELVFEAEGVESSVALTGSNGYSLIVNGKSDGNVRADAPTTVMLGMLGALLHPGVPRQGLIVGLGTGTSAGWLSELPSMERVDVVELEPAVEEAALRCAPLGRWARGKPRTTLTVADAREIVLTTRRKYDVIMSEPSNPYRAGVASLFTLEYFGALSERMEEGALFAQWLQAYEVDAATVRTVYATMAEVFPWVETWEVGPGDLLLLASRRPLRHDLARLRERLGQEPFRSALFNAWRADTVESVLAHHLAAAPFAHDMREAHGELNTDDRTVLEFGFGRQVGQRGNFNLLDLFALASARGQARPEVDGPVDWGEVGAARAASRAFRSQADPLPGLGEAELKLLQALQRHVRGDARGAAADWTALGREPRSAVELSVVAELLVRAGDGRAEPYLDRLRERAPVDARLLLAALRQAQGKPAEAARILEEALIAARTDPWGTPRLLEEGVRLASELPGQSKDALPGLMRALEQPFSVNLAEERRALRRLDLAIRDGSTRACLDALQPLEPQVPFYQPILTFRLECYRRAGDPRAAAAERDLDDLLELGQIPLQLGLTPTPAPPGR